jgi:hypothetical protein
MVRNRRIPSSDELTQREESMTTIKAFRLASLVTMDLRMPISYPTALEEAVGSEPRPPSVSAASLSADSAYLG